MTFMGVAFMGLVGVFSGVLLYTYWPEKKCKECGVFTVYQCELFTSDMCEGCHKDWEQSLKLP